MKRILSVICTLALLLTASVFAVSATESYELTSHITSGFGAPGDTVTVALDVDTNTVGFASMTFDVSFDEKLTLVEVSSTTLFGLSYQEGEKKGGVYQNPYRSVWYGTTPTTATGRALVLTFEISESANIGDELFITASAVDVRYDENDANSAALYKINGGAISVTNRYVETAADKFTYVEDETGVTVTGYKHNADGLSDYAIAIPEKINGKPVVAIDSQNENAGAFEGNEQVKAVYIPASVKTVANYSFFNCSALLDYYVYGEADVEGVAIGYVQGSRGSVALAGVTLHGWTDGKTAAYATDNGFGFVGLENVFAKGYQKSTGEGLAIRFVAELSLAEYCEIAGLDVVAAVEGGDTRSFTAPITTVYKKLIANAGNGIYEEVTPEAGNYLMARSIYNIPQDLSITFTVTPYVVNPAGVRVNGAPVTVTCNAGNVAQA